MTSRSFQGNELGSKHFVFLAMASAGLGVIAFLLGVMVGRGVPLVEMVTGEEFVSPSGEESFVVGGQPVVARTTRREPSVAATDGAGLSYFHRLDEDRGAELDARLLDQTAPDAATQAAGAGGAAEGSVPAGMGSYPEQSDGYAIQVTTLRESAAAESMAQGLIGKGYPAFVVAPTPDVPVRVFRVRVGTYENREEAEQILRRLEGEESFKPWITR